ncbi:MULTISPECIES: hypothetical protein [unclassified Acinetobacter]|uniref:hypothetical protein n=1 Tax=unclassified Acinetobacter TaxID=196816 RepID=UPI00124C86FF|nr:MULTISPECIES: hypothetical protein [unclassified Acinetobacter]
MSTLQQISAPLEAFSQILSPAQVFESLSKGIGIEYAEIETNDWSIIEKNCPISVADIYGGCLKFRFSMKTFETQRFKEKSAKYFCEFLNHDGEGNERYRMGFDNPTIYVLKKNSNAKLPAGLSKYLIWGAYLNGFEFFIERNGKLIHTLLSEKVTPQLYAARRAKEAAKKAEFLDRNGFFDNLPPRKRKVLG